MTDGLRSKSESFSMWVNLHSYLRVASKPIAQPVRCRGATSGRSDKSRDLWQSRQRARGPARLALLPGMVGCRISPLAVWSVSGPHPLHQGDTSLSPTLVQGMKMAVASRCSHHLERQ